MIDVIGWWGLWRMVQRNSKRSGQTHPESASRILCSLRWWPPVSLDQMHWEWPAAPSGCAWKMEKMQMIPFERPEWKDTNTSADNAELVGRENNKNSCTHKWQAFDIQNSVRQFRERKCDILWGQTRLYGFLNYSESTGENLISENVGTAGWLSG